MIGDALTCGAWVAAVGATFASRTVTGKHYLTDNLLGLGLGAFSGMAIPYFLHYGQTRTIADAAPRGDGAGPRLRGLGVRPGPGSHGLELSVYGTL